MALRTHRYRHCPFLFIFLLIIRLRMIHHYISSFRLLCCAFIVYLKRRKYQKCDGFANASISTLSTFIRVIFINNFKNDISLYIIVKSLRLLSIYFKKEKISEMQWLCERIDINIVQFYSRDFY